jgi:hypothetical protein
MRKRRFDKLDSYAGRLRRSSREIVIASALTLAALAFIVAALVGGTVNTETDVGHIAADEKIIK